MSPPNAVSKWLRNTFIKSRLLALAMMLNASGAEYYVATDGDDTHDGISLETPLASLQKALAKTVAGDTVHVRGGTYRQQVTATTGGGTANAYLKIQSYGEERPVFKGSDIVTGWEPYQGAIWKKTGWTINSQQVFCNEKYLQQIGLPHLSYTSMHYTPVGAGISDMTPGSFYYDSSAATLYVWLHAGDDPNAATMEVSTKRWVLSLYQIPCVHVKGLTVRHCNSSATIPGGVAVSISPDSIIEECDIQWCDFEGLELSSRSQALRCIISNNGDVGVGGNTRENILVRGCIINGNNYRNFNPYWHAGGLKLIPNTSGIIEDNEICNNNGNAVWFDWCKTGKPIVVRNNRLRNNAKSAIFIEASSNAFIYNNLLVSNPLRGIYISGSDNTRSYHNTIIGTGGYAALCLAGVPRADCTLKNNRVFNNIVFGSTCIFDLIIPQDNGGDTEGNTSDYNCFFRTSGSLTLNSSGKTHSSLAALRAATGFDRHSISEDPRFNLSTLDDYSTPPASAVADSGMELPEVTDDIRGEPRPQGGAWDMGAFETRLQDYIPPTANAGPDFSAVDQDGNTLESVILDASTSVAGSGPLTSFVWFEGGIPIASGIRPSVDLTLGPHTLSLLVTDSKGLQSTDEIVVTISVRPFMNGSFEADFTGWTATGNQTVESAAPYKASDGSKLVVFNSGNVPPTAVLSQFFATTPGLTYSLAFDVGVLAFNKNSQQLLVSVSGARTLLSKSITLTGLGKGDIRWFSRKFTFVADSTSATLTFRDLSTSHLFIDLLIDHVRVIPQIHTPPLALADAYSTNQDTPLVVAAAGVLANDTDPGLSPLNAVLNTGTTQGRIALNANGGFSYTPAAGFTGTDSFTYHANNGLLDSAIVRVDLTVNQIVAGTLANGSFESDFAGWSATGNLKIAAQSAYNSTDGSKVVVFNSGNTAPNAVLFQSFTITQGQTYTLEFDVGLIAYNKSPQKLLVKVIGKDTLLSQTILLNGSGESTIFWQPRSFSFVAGGTSATLIFLDQSTSTQSIDLFLDHVRMHEAAVVPPETIAKPDRLGAPSLTRTYGACSISMTAPRAGSYVLEHSHDLLRWEIITERPVAEPGPIEFQNLQNPDAAEPSGKPIFYRIGLRP